jgi:hypothetical protein
MMEEEYGFYDQILALPVIETAKAVEGVLQGNFENDFGLLLVYE